jgi:Pyridoxamine 5'-phosphate oxidase
MGRVYDRIDDRMRAFLERQAVFFVGTAPLATDGHVNVSPKGMQGTFAVLGPSSVAYLDLTGSGVETIAHLRENGRITLTFCSFDGPPRIVRLSGRGEVVLPDDARFPALEQRFSRLEGVRAVVTVEVDRIADSCGYAVPRMDLVGDRDRLAKWSASKGPEGLVDYRRQTNAHSIDGLPGIDP